MTADSLTFLRWLIELFGFFCVGYFIGTGLREFLAFRRCRTDCNAHEQRHDLRYQPGVPVINPVGESNPHKTDTCPFNVAFGSCSLNCSRCIKLNSSHCNVMLPLMLGVIGVYAVAIGCRELSCRTDKVPSGGDSGGGATGVVVKHSDSPSVEKHQSTEGGVA